MSKKETIMIECVDCGYVFEVSAEEQAWYEEKGFTLPKRCHKCRKTRRNNKSKDRK